MPYITWPNIKRYENYMEIVNIQFYITFSTLMSKTYNSRHFWPTRVTDAYTHAYIHACTQAQCTHMPIHTWTCTHAHMHMACMQMAHVHIHTSCMYACMQTHMYMHKHTHMSESNNF